MNDRCTAMWTVLNVLQCVILTPTVTMNTKIITKPTYKLWHSSEWNMICKHRLVMYHETYDKYVLGSTAMRLPRFIDLYHYWIQTLHDMEVSQLFTISLLLP